MINPAQIEGNKLLLPNNNYVALICMNIYIYIYIYIYIWLWPLLQ
jgi:hypothetical protein